MTKEEVQFLYEYDRWADQKLFESVAALPVEQYMKDLGSSFKGIHGTLVHMLSANKAWLNRWKGVAPELLKPEDFPDLGAVKKAWDIFNLEMKNFVSDLKETKLNESFGYTDFKGKSFSHPLHQHMQHKVNHSTYHRGQIVTMLRQLGAGAASTDLILYIRQKESRG